MKNLGNNNYYKEYNGNIFWLLEAVKTLCKESKINLKSKFDNSEIKEFKFYECIILNDDKEDALYIQIKDKILEFLSNDRFNLILNLINIFKKRLTNSKFLRADFELPKINSFKIINEKESNENYSPLSSNLLITYKDNTYIWKYDCDLKKILFNFKFLPNYNKIKSIRIFPMNIKKLNTRLHSYFDKENEYIEDKIKRNNCYLYKEDQHEMFHLFVEKLKLIFYEKFYLRLKKLDIETFELNGEVFIHDVKEMLLEKQDFNLVKLKSEGLILKNKHQIQSIKDAPNSKDLKSFFFSMMRFYDEAKTNLKIEKYLSPPQKDETTDELFKILRPECPYKFSKLIEDDVSIAKFTKYASTNLNKKL